jgi:hypothetical protein
VFDTSAEEENIMQTEQQLRPNGASADAAPLGGERGYETAAAINEEVCPYFKRDRGGGRVVCEGASFKFPDNLSRREYLYRFCAHPVGYKSCPLKVALDHYYERKYDYQA